MDGRGTGLALSVVSNDYEEIKDREWQEKLCVKNSSGRRNSPCGNIIAACNVAAAARTCAGSASAVFVFGISRSMAKFPA
jgi:hypothetical protein